MSSRIDQLKKMYLQAQKPKKLCPYLLEQEEEYPCDKPEGKCNSGDCETFKIVVDMGAY